MQLIILSLMLQSTDIIIEELRKVGRTHFLHKSERYVIYLIEIVVFVHSFSAPIRVLHLFLIFVHVRYLS
jgi:hypothetical protein